MGFFKKTAERLKIKATDAVKEEVGKASDSLISTLFGFAGTAVCFFALNKSMNGKPDKPESAYSTIYITTNNYYGYSGGKRHEEDHNAQDRKNHRR